MRVRMYICTVSQLYVLTEQLKGIINMFRTIHCSSPPPSPPHIHTNIHTCVPLPCSMQDYSSLSLTVPLYVRTSQLQHIIDVVLHDCFLSLQDVNEQNLWVSALRKACLCNRQMDNVFHPGAFRARVWTCCRSQYKTGEGLGLSIGA